MIKLVLNLKEIFFFELNIICIFLLLIILHLKYNVCINQNMKKFWLMSNNVYDFCVPFYLLVFSIPIKNWCYIRNLSLATVNSNINVKKKLCSLLTNVREKKLIVLLPFYEVKLQP